MRKAPLVAAVSLVLQTLSSLPSVSRAQGAPDRAVFLAAAREIMAAQTYCALITIGEGGRPDVRTMNPFPPDDDFVVYLATSTLSRKVEEIRRDPRVTLYYSDHKNAIGYVALIGHADLTEDKAEIQKRKRAYWDEAFPGLKNLTLIRVIPERLEVVNYRAGFVNDKETFRAPSIDLPPPGK